VEINRRVTEVKKYNMEVKRKMAGGVDMAFYSATTTPTRPVGGNLTPTGVAYLR